MEEGGPTRKLERLVVSPKFMHVVLLSGQELDMVCTDREVRDEINELLAEYVDEPVEVDYHTPIWVNFNGDIAAVNALRQILGYMKVDVYALPSEYDVPDNESSYLTTPLASLDVLSGQTIADPYPVDKWFSFTSQDREALQFREELNRFRTTKSRWNPGLYWNTFRDNADVFLTGYERELIGANGKSGDPDQSVPRAQSQYGLPPELVDLGRRAFGYMVANGAMFKDTLGGKIDDFIVVELPRFDRLFGEFPHILPPTGLEFYDINDTDVA